MGGIRRFASKLFSRTIAQHRAQGRNSLGTNGNTPGKKSTNGSKPIVLSRLPEMKWKFPWSEPTREYKRQNFSLTLYKDGSRLYIFKGGGHLILTPEGSAILKADPKVIRRYFDGKKLEFAEGGQAVINTLRAEESLIALKEHTYRTGILSSAYSSGISAIEQLEHMRQIKYELEKSKSLHSAPTYFAAGELPVEKMGPTNGARKRAEAVSAMEFIEGKKVSRIVAELKHKGDRESMRKLDKLMTDYKSFLRFLRKRDLPLTDVHDGNVLTRYNDKLKRYTFTIIDQ